MGVTLAVVEDRDSLPASFGFGVDLAKMGNDVLTRPGVSTSALDEREVNVGLTILGSAVAAHEHVGLLV